MDMDIDMKEQYIEMFQEMDFRAFRAMIMNYEESHRYDNWARKTDIIAKVALVLSAVSSPPAIFYKLMPSSTLKIGLTLSVGASGLLELYSQAPFWSASLAGRAQKHVNAGAEWHRIHQLAKLYSSELKVTRQKDIQWDQQRERYFSLLNAYKEASMFTVIRGKAYDEHSKIDLIFKRMEEREKQLAAFQEREESKRTWASP